jgi:hypothetical protein
MDNDSLLHEGQTGIMATFCMATFRYENANAEAILKRTPYALKQLAAAAGLTLDPICTIEIHPDGVDAKTFIEFEFAQHTSFPRGFFADAALVCVDFIADAGEEDCGLVSANLKAHDKSPKPLTIDMTDATRDLGGYVKALNNAQTAHDLQNL